MTVSVAPLAIDPIGQVTTPPAFEQVPCEAFALTKPAPFGQGVDDGDAGRGVGPVVGDGQRVGELLAERDRLAEACLAIERSADPGAGFTVVCSVSALLPGSGRR